MSILDTIVERKRHEIENLPVVAPEKCERDFSVFEGTTPFIIAEIKAASPSEGVIADPFEPEKIARQYDAGGADAISVLTDHDFFGGGFDVLKRVRGLTALPLLCKDFIIDPRQIEVARSCGADFCLLIVKILTNEELADLKQVIEGWGMEAMIEVQNEEELERALKVEPKFLLINNRNLTSFEVDIQTTMSLIDDIDPSLKTIAASGIKAPDDLKTFPERVDGFLIGTALMRSDNPKEFLEQCKQK